MIAMTKPPHKFFERYLDNNLDELTSYLLEKRKWIYENGINAPEDVFKEKRDRGDSLVTMLGDYYNIFTWDNPSIKKIYDGLVDATKEACEYYGIDFDAADYYVCGWFNVNENGTVYSGDSPLNHPEWFHDHMHGIGAPVFHGYYCVNAEPSSTYYFINKDQNNIFENANKNNRLIVSETGHPHAIENWSWDGPRITIAYDISPRNKDLVSHDFVGKHWIKLG
jgi:hypothetical protein